MTIPELKPDPPKRFRVFNITMSGPDQFEPTEFWEVAEEFTPLLEDRCEAGVGIWQVAIVRWLREKHGGYVRDFDYEEIA